MTIDLIKAMTTRRTILDHKPEKIERPVLNELFNLSACAPNHHMKQPWRIRVYEDEARSMFGEKVVDSYIRLGYLKSLDEKKLEKARAAFDRFFRSVPHHALVYMDKRIMTGIWTMKTLLRFALLSRISN